MHFSDLKQALLNRGEFWEDAVEIAALHMSRVQSGFFFENLYRNVLANAKAESSPTHGYVGKNKY